MRRTVPGAAPSRATPYEGCGFVVEGTLRDELEIAGRSVDDLLMARFP